MRNITTQFSLFEDSNTKLYKATIECELNDPDTKYQFTVYGIGRDKREAAIFSLATAWMTATGTINDTNIPEGKAIDDLDEALSYIDNYGSEDDVNKMVNDDLDSDYFGDHGTSCEAYLEWEEMFSSMPGQTSKVASMMRGFGKQLPIDEVGGYVIGIESEPQSDEDEDE